MNLNDLEAGKFDSNSDDFRLVLEAYRMSAAYLFELYPAVNSSLIELLPHQISEVAAT